MRFTDTWPIVALCVYRDDDDDDDDDSIDGDDNVSLLVTISRARFISQEESDYCGKQLFIVSCDDVTHGNHNFRIRDNNSYINKTFRNYISRYDI